MYYFIPSPVVAIFMKSGVVDRAALEFLVAAAFPISLAISSALTGFLANFFPKLTVALPTLLKKPFSHPASIVASLTVIDLLVFTFSTITF